MTHQPPNGPPRSPGPSQPGPSQPGPSQPGQPQPGQPQPGQHYPLGPPPPGPPQPPGPWQINSPWQQHGPAAGRPQIEEPHIPTRSGRQPFGNPPPRPVHIETFAPPKQKWTKWVGIGAIALVTIVVLLTFVFPPGVLSPTPTPTTTSRTASTPQANVVEFVSEYDRTTTGRWEVIQSRWGSGYVDVEMKIDLAGGNLAFSFYAFGNSASTGVESTTTERSPDISTGRLTAGESIQGWVRFPLPREASTVILATSTHRQIAALPITV